MGITIVNVICIPVGALQTNCYLVFDEKKTGVVVDPGGNAPQIIDTIQKEGLHIVHILLTHVHFDHVLAAEEVMKATGADFLVPRDDEEALSRPARSLVHFLGRKSIVLPKADRVMAEGDEIAAGGLRFSVLHTPGHTPGSSCFLCGDILLSGDTLFAGGAGRTDFPGGDSSSLRDSLKRLSDLEGDYTVLPGHGPQTTLPVEKRQNPYMQNGHYDFDY